jgi:hypothetical protein
MRACRRWGRQADRSRAHVARQRPAAYLYGVVPRREHPQLPPTGCSPVGKATWSWLVWQASGKAAVAHVVQRPACQAEGGSQARLRQTPVVALVQLAGVAGGCRGVHVGEDPWDAHDRMGAGFQQHAAGSVYNAHYELWGSITLSWPLTCDVMAGPVAVMLPLILVDQPAPGPSAAVFPPPYFRRPHVADHGCGDVVTIR